MRQSATRHHHAVALRPLQAHVMIHEKKISFDDLHHSGLGQGGGDTLFQGFKCLLLGITP